MSDIITAITVKNMAREMVKKAMVKNSTLKANEIKSTDIRGAIKEIELKHSAFAAEVARKRGWAIGDAIEAIATHIIYNDTDYTI